MPSYDFKCPDCGLEMPNRVMRISEYHRPECACGTEMQAVIHVPMIHWKDFEFKNGGYQPVSVRGAEPITSHRQEREFMAKHNLVHANDMGPPPTKAEQMAHHNDVVLPSISKVADSDGVVDDII